MGNVIIIAIIVVLVLNGIYSGMKHFKGEGGHRIFRKGCKR